MYSSVFVAIFVLLGILLIVPHNQHEHLIYNYDIEDLVVCDLFEIIYWIKKPTKIEEEESALEPNIQRKG